jgi:M6 family metalloprotease-like protein
MLSFKSKFSVFVAGLAAGTAMLGSMVNTAWAAPATNVVQEKTQPDGSTIQVRLRGDEWFHWWETIDGRPIVQDKRSRAWLYAVPNSNGRLSFSSRAVGKSAPPAAPWTPRPSQGAITRHLQAHGRAEIPTTGEGKIPVILIAFKDRAPKYGKAQFQELLFGNGRSMKKLYEEMSYGKFTVSPGPSGISGWFTASKDHDYYGRDESEENKDVNTGELIVEAVTKADKAGFNFGPYDRDNDGFVDVVDIVHQGGDQSEGAGDNEIWSHKYDLESLGITPIQTNDLNARGQKVKINRYVIQPEFSGTETTIAKMAVFAHEYGHALGLPDLYDADYSSSGLGEWSLMAGGTNIDNGVTPPHMDAWCKFKMGWLQPVVSTTNARGVSIPTSSRQPFALRLWTRGQGGNEYFLVENRQKVGFDAKLPGSGLLIYHIDDAVQSENKNEWIPPTRINSGHYQVAIEQADGLFQLEKKDGSSDIGDLFGNIEGGTTRREFSDTTRPSSRSYANQPTLVALRNISNSAATMTADVSVTTDGASPSPTPPNNDFARAQVLSGNQGRVTGSNVNATKETGEPNHVGATSGGRSVWYRYTAPGSGTLSLNTANSAFDTLLAVYTGAAVNSLRAVASNDDVSANDATSALKFAVTSGTTYFIAIDGLDGSKGNLTLAYSLALSGIQRPANDNFANAQAVSGASGSVSGSSVNASKESGEPAHAGEPGGRSVWYRYVVTQPGKLTFTTLNSNFDTVLAVYRGTALTALTQIGSNDDTTTDGSERSSIVSFAATAGTYYIAVDGITGASGAIKFNWKFEPTNVPPPVNDDIEDAEEVSGPQGVMRGSNAGATEEEDETDGGSAGDNSVWYEWTAPSDGFVQFDTEGSDFDTILFVAEFPGGRKVEETQESDEPNLVALNDDYTDEDIWSLVEFRVVKGHTYYIGVDGYAGDTGEIVLSYALDDKAPVLTITSPVANAQVTALTAINGTVADETDGTGVERVDIVIWRRSDNTYWNGSAWGETSTRLATTLNRNQWSISSNLPGDTNLRSDIYTIAAIAYDLGGNRSVVQHNVVVKNQSLPVVAFTSPTDGAQLTSLGVIAGTASAGEGGGITRVRLLIRRNSDGRYWNGNGAWTNESTQLPAELNGENWRLATSNPAGANLANGSYSLSAVAYDRSGQKVLSTINVTIARTSM